MNPFPFDHPRVRRVGSFDELIRTPFAKGVNALCWERTLDGDFAEVISKLATGPGIVALDAEVLENLDLSVAGRKAVGLMLGDLRLLREREFLPELNCIRGYVREEDAGVIRTDVYSFHVDSAPVQADTWLCTYHGEPSEVLANEEAVRQVDVAAIRALLLDDFGGDDDEAFAEYLADHCYDLHYAPAPNAKPFSLGGGNLWRIALNYPGAPVPPCIHRAPDSLPGAEPRLLLIG